MNKLKISEKMNKPDCPASKLCRSGMWLWNIPSEQIIFSNQWKKNLGFSPGEINGSIEEWFGRIHNKDIDSVKKTIEKIKNGGQQPDSIIYRIASKDGSYRWMRSVVSVKEFDENNYPKVLLGVEEDINEFKTNEEYLREVNLRFSKLVENFGGAILLEDENRRIFFTNQQFCQYFGIPLNPIDLIGADCAEASEASKVLFTEPDRFISTINEALKNKAPVFGEQFQLVNGKMLERDYIPVFDDDLYKGHLWLYRDITRFKQNEEKLRARLQFETLIAELSSKFIATPWKDIDEGINDTLGLIGSFIGVDRSYIFLYTDDGKIMSNTHEWVNEGVTPEKENLQNLPSDISPWWFNKVLNNENIVLPTLEHIPPEAEELHDILGPQQIKSLLVVPMIYDNKAVGYIGFDAVYNYRDWDEDGVKLLKMAAGVIINAIKRKENEEALFLSENKYRTVVNNVKEVIFQTDAEGKWIFLNPAWTEITGFTIEESIGTNFLHYVYEDDRERNLKLFEPLIRKEKEYCRHEIRYNTKDGGYKWIEVFARLTYDENNNVAGTSGTLKDVTQKRKSEEEIRKLSRVVETTPSAILLTDLKGKITYSNPGLLKLGKFNSASALIGRSIFEFTNDEGKKLLVKTVIPLLIRGEEWSGEIELIKSDGTVFPAEMICSIIEDENKKPQYLVSNFYDITHRKKAEAEIFNALTAEKELNELKSKFVSMVSHEFRTPLAAILSSSELLEYYWDRWTKEKRNSLLGKIKVSIKNLIDLLNDITEINRADSGKIKIIYEEIDFAAFTDDIITELTLGFEEVPKVQFEKPAERYIFNSDKKLVRQIWVNLISNAIKYTPANKNIYISLGYENDSVHFVIKDEGIGIPYEDQKNLYEPFMRSKNIGKIKGTGLGLSITKRAVEALNGKINFLSEINKGTTFKVTIPVM